jgi:hypothetical protein
MQKAGISEYPPGLSIGSAVSPRRRSRPPGLRNGSCIGVSGPRRLPGESIKRKPRQLSIRYPEFCRGPADLSDLGQLPAPPGLPGRVAASSVISRRPRNRRWRVLRRSESHVRRDRPDARLCSRLRRWSLARAVPAWLRPDDRQRDQQARFQHRHGQKLGRDSLSLRFVGGDALGRHCHPARSRSNLHRRLRRLRIHAFRRHACQNQPKRRGELAVRFRLAILTLFAVTLMAQAPITFQYFYEDTGHLIKVVDSSISQRSMAGRSVRSRFYGD